MKIVEGLSSKSSINETKEIKTEGPHVDHKGAYYNVAGNK